MIVSGGVDGVMRVWDPATGTAIGDPLPGHTGPVVAGAIGRADDPDVIVSGGRDWTVRVWDAATRTRVAIQDTLGPVNSIAAAPGLIAIATGRAICLATLA